LERVHLQELNMASREEALLFLKKLWRGDAAACPLCGRPLELLHKKRKKSDCDWQCKVCDKVFRTIHLLDEINELLP